jgi:hypothetical protein
MTSALDYQDRAWLGGPSLDPGWLDPAGTNPDGLDRALQSFGYSRMLPSAAYTSPEVLAWECRYLFAATWTCVGREADLRQSSGAGREVTQRALLVGEVPVLLTWLEGDHRELPRVLPLSADPPRALPGHPAPARERTTSCPAPDRWVHGPARGHGHHVDDG